MDLENNLYVADAANQRIQVFDRDGQVVASWQTTDDQTPFKFPVGLAFRSSGIQLYVVDAFAHRIHRFWRSGNLIDSWGEEAFGQFLTPFTIDALQRVCYQV